MVALDGLHPSAYQYSLWVDEILRSYSEDDVLNITKIDDVPAPLFSNPVFDDIDFSREVDGVIIFDTKGLIVAQYGSCSSVSLSYLPSGLYFLCAEGKRYKMLKV